ncbi:MAG: hypothetical protein AAGI71_05305 [Bacteroidota bacterium]
MPWGRRRSPWSSAQGSTAQVEPSRPGVSTIQIGRSVDVEGVRGVQHVAERPAFSEMGDSEVGSGLGTA